MRTRIITAVFLIAGVLLALFLFPFPVFLVLVNVASLLGYNEMKKLSGKVETPISVVTLASLFALPWLWNYFPQLVVPALTATLLACIFGILLGPPPELRHCFPQVSFSLFSLLYLGIPFSILSTFQINSPASTADSGRIWELGLVFLSLWISDSAAYFTGRAIGKHKVTPRISPNKSLEGFIAGLIAPAIVAVIYGIYLLPQYPVWFLAIVGLVLGISGIMGDLFESALKRGAGIKDSSGLFPGHGGLLDRTDSILAGMPAFFLLKLIWEWPW